MSDYKIGIGIWDGVEELDFAGPYEVLTAWARYADDRSITVETIAAGDGPVTCAHGLRVLPDATWGEGDQFDLFLLPGGDTRPLQADDGFLARMRKLAADGTLMASVCTGALVYAKAGLLAGRPATTHWSALERLADLDVEVDADARYVDDGDVVTAAGVSAGIDMALHLVARLDSVERAQQVRRYIQYDPEPPV
jgi:transcriptional regulator GlxA family with amidase domain